MDTQIARKVYGRRLRCVIILVKDSAMIAAAVAIVHCLEI